MLEGGGEPGTLAPQGVMMALAAAGSGSRRSDPSRLLFLAGGALRRSRGSAWPLPVAAGLAAASFSAASESVLAHGTT